MENMSIGYNLIYRLEGLQHQGEGDVHAHSFNIHLDSDFARKAFQTELPEHVYDELNKQGEDVIKRINRNGFVPTPIYSFYNNKKGRSLLLCFTKTIGDACELGLDNSEFEDLFKKYSDKTILYSYHNIDSLSQKVSLLSLFVNWVDIAELLIK